MRQTELDALRAEAKALASAATKKIGRNKRVKGVVLEGTKADPRRNPQNVKRYTARQLKTYIGELKAFNSRKTQFVADVRHAPIATTLWDQYQTLEAKVNAKIASDFDKVKDIYIPMRNMTIGERMKMITPDHLQMHNPANRSPHAKLSREPRNIGSEKSLQKLIKDLKNQLTTRHDYQEIKRGRAEMSAMADYIGNVDLRKDLAALTDKQFAILWNWNGLANALSLQYEHRKKLLTKGEAAFDSSELDVITGDIRAGIAWAKTLKLGS